MRHEIIISEKHWNLLHGHLLSGQTEQLAFLLAGISCSRSETRLLVREVILARPEDMEYQSVVYLQPKRKFTRDLLRRCDLEQMSLIEVHSHPFCQRDVGFSGLDIHNQRIKYRYVAKRLPQIRHAAMVVGQSDIDASIWNFRTRKMVPIDMVRVIGQTITDIMPTSKRLNREISTISERLNRQVLMFGEKGQARLRNVCAGVVGCGGTGSALAQLLAMLGVRDMVLVDDDVVEESNRNRLMGTTAADAIRKEPKVNLARRVARRIDPGIRIRRVNLPVQSAEAIEALKQCDILFGCTDGHGSRLILNQLAVQYLIPYMDLGCGIQAGDTVNYVGGQVATVLPGGFCLSCIDRIDRVAAAQELGDEISKRRFTARGYIKDSDMPTPSVAFLNHMVAALAVNEFVCLWLGVRPVRQLLYFDLIGNKTTIANSGKNESCLTCQDYGMGNLLPIIDTGSNVMCQTIPTIKGD